MKLSASSFFVHNSSLRNRAENNVLPRHVFAVLTGKRWAKKSVKIFDAHTVALGLLSEFQSYKV